MNKSYQNYKCEKCEKLYNASYVNQRFCSRSCSCSGVKRRTKRINYCSGEGCVNEVEYYTNKFCRQCKDKKAHFARNSSKGILLENQTIEQASLKRGGANHYDNIRWAARRKMSTRIEENTGCSSCGWLHHVHVCHIKAIKDFPKDALVSDVNDFSNLVLLCPNCHWLFDNESGARGGN